MKRIVAVLFSVLFICLALCGCDEIKSGDLRFDPFDELVVCTPDTVSDEIEELYGQEKSSIIEDMKSGSILLSGARKDRKLSFNVVCETTEFSSQVKDLTLYTQLQLNDISASLLPDYLTYHRTEDEVYVYADSVVMGTNHPYCTRQYVTVKNGKLYVIAFTTDDELFEVEDEERMLEVIEHLSIKKDLSSDILPIILVSVSLVAVIVLVVFIVISLVKDIKNKNKN